MALKSTKAKRPSIGYSFLSGAKNFVLKYPAFVENRPQIIQIFAAGQPLLELIALHTDPNTYKSLTTAQLANDPQLMFKACHIQFNQLIVEPLLQLQTQRGKHIPEPLPIVLDGLDECKGENGQREIIEMISEATGFKKGLPLLWLICGRPEAHLKYVFSRADYAVNCGREELVIGAESIADVNFYTRDGLAGIKADFLDVTTRTRPAKGRNTYRSLMLFTPEFFMTYQMRPRHLQPIPLPPLQQQTLKGHGPYNGLPTSPLLAEL